MAGTIGQFRAYGDVQFDVALSLGTDSTQDRQTLRWFGTLLSSATTAAGAGIGDAAHLALTTSANSRTLLLLDCCRLDLEEDQKAALFQLCVHFAGAYFKRRSTP